MVPEQESERGKSDRVVPGPGGRESQVHSRRWTNRRRSGRGLGGTYALGVRERKGPDVEKEPFRYEPVPKLFRFLKVSGPDRDGEGSRDLTIQWTMSP